MLLVSLLIGACSEDPNAQNPVAPKPPATKPRNQNSESSPDAAVAATSAGATTADTASRVSADAGTPTQPGSDASSASVTLCDKYGGSAAVGAVVTQFVVPALTQDCRINAYFAALSEPGVQRVSECLSIQVQELFACTGITYAGSRASNGLPCRSMAKAHIGLQISQGDFDALIEDVVSAMAAAGVSAEDIGLAAPALLGLQSDIVEQATTTQPLSACE
jgi:hypothetical protein